MFDDGILVTDEIGALQKLNADVAPVSMKAALVRTYVS